MSKLANHSKPKTSPIQIGQVFTRLIVIADEGIAPQDKHYTRRWRCRCECGNEVVTKADALRSKRTQSCGCLNRETSRIQGRKNATHGMTTIKLDGGKRVPSEYKTWQEMRNRCHNPNKDNYCHYGGRGIKVCDAWDHSFEQFYEDVGPKPTPRHTLDRIDNNGNYEPGNVRWATKKEQARNTRKNAVIKIGGIARCLAEWAEISGIDSETISARLKRKWPEDTLLAPIGTRLRSRWAAASGDDRTGE